MRSAIGAEFPERGAISLGGASGGEAGEFTGTDEGGVIVAVDVSGDEMEEVVLIEQPGVEADAGFKVGREVEVKFQMIVHGMDLEPAIDAFVGESISIGAGLKGEIDPTSLLEGGE